MMSSIPLCTCFMASMAIVVGYGGRDVVVCSSGGGMNGLDEWVEPCGIDDRLLFFVIISRCLDHEPFGCGF